MKSIKSSETPAHTTHHANTPWYVGSCWDTDRTAFQSATTPDLAVLTQFDMIHGPFSSKKVAEDFANNTDYLTALHAEIAHNPDFVAPAGFGDFARPDSVKPEAATETTKKFYYVGEICFTARTVLESDTELSIHERSTKWPSYDAIAGPFTSKDAAKIFADSYGGLSIEQAEEKAKSLVAR